MNPGSSRTRLAARPCLPALLFVVAGACGTVGPGDPLDPDDPGDSPVIDEAIVATFDVSGERFRVRVTNETTIEDIFALQARTSRANIPNGKLLAGAGAGSHNAPWSWHLDPDDIHMAENTIEACDGRPSLVEANLDDYLALGRFCPWSARLESIEDDR